MTSDQSTKELLSLVADAVSIIGVFATVFIALAVRRLRALYLFKARVPQLTSRIAAAASEISTLAADFSNTRDQVVVEFRRVAVLIELLGRKSSRAERAAARQMVKKIRRSQINTRAEVTDLYGDIQALVARFEEVQLDREWEY